MEVSGKNQVRLCPWEDSFLYSLCMTVCGTSSRNGNSEGNKLLPLFEFKPRTVLPTTY
jgi:hypothetical protein